MKGEKKAREKHVELPGLADTIAELLNASIVSSTTTEWLCSTEVLRTWYETRFSAFVTPLHSERKASNPDPCFFGATARLILEF